MVRCHLNCKWVVVCAARHVICRSVVGVAARLFLNTVDRGMFSRWDMIETVIKLLLSRRGHWFNCRATVVVADRLVLFGRLLDFKTPDIPHQFTMKLTHAQSDPPSPPISLPANVKTRRSTHVQSILIIGNLTESAEGLNLTWPPNGTQVRSVYTCGRNAWLDAFPP